MHTGHRFSLKSSPFLCVTDSLTKELGIFQNVICVCVCVRVRACVRDAIELSHRRRKV